jgi:hypothetical protein
VQFVIVAAAEGAKAAVAINHSFQDEATSTEDRPRDGHASAGSQLRQ